MDVDDCRTALAGLVPPVVAGDLVAIEGGWSFWTFTDRTLVARFPRTEADARSLERELAVLPVLASHLSVPVPRVVATGSYRGAPFAVYDYLPGRPVAAAELAAPGSPFAGELGRTLRALHSVPLEALPISRQAADAWWQRKLLFFDDCRERAFPLLPHDVVEQAEAAIARMGRRVAAREVPAVFAHNDLGLVHVLTDGEDLTGIIDWTDAEVTDPAIDFVGIRAAGEAPLRAVLEHYGPPPGPAFEERLWFLSWVAPLHDILYGLDTGDSAILAGGISGVSSRIRRLI